MSAAETQHSIARWADHAFGKAPDPARIASRANEEMAELLRHATSNQPSEKLIEEAADVVIVLMRMADVIGEDLAKEIDRKMVVNRGRVWNKDGTGHGYHVRDK